MKFTVLRENLQKALSIIQRIVIKNPSLPVLENVLIETENKRLKLSATNLELGAHTWVKGKMEDGGRLSIPSLLLSNIVANVKEERILLERKGVNLEITTEHFQGLIKGQDPNDFPLIPKPEMRAHTSLTGKKILEGLSQVHHIITVSEVYPEISGIFFSFNKGGLTLVGTDSFRLGKKEIGERIQKEFGGTSFILPLKSSQELIYVLEQAPGATFTLGVNENQALFSLDDIQIVSRLLSGTYPNWSDLLPKDSLMDIAVSRQDFIETIKLISVFAPKTNDCKIEILHSGLKVSSTTNQGSSEATCRARVKGSGLSEITFNYRYLLDGLLRIPAKEIEIRIKNESTPVLFHGVGDESYVYIVAPLKS